MTAKIMPSDEASESLLLSAALNSINAANEVFYTLSEQDFYSPKNRLLFEEMKFLNGKGASLDTHMLISHLKAKDCLSNCGGIQYVLTLAVICPTASGLDYVYYCNKLKNLTALRHLIRSGQEIVDMAVCPLASSQEIAQQAFKKLFALSGSSSTETKATKDILDKYSDHGSFEENLEWMCQRANNNLTPYLGISCGFPLLDRVLGFFRPGCIYYIGARTSMGKTTFLLNLANGMLSNGKSVPIGIFSLEMPSEILAAKMLCMMSDIRFSAYEDGHLKPEEVDRLNERAQYMRKMPVFIEDQEDLNISLLRARARRMVQSYGVKIIFIDYLTRIKSDTKYSSKHLQVDEISKGLQSMAKELKVPVICLAQLNRASINKTEPTLSDFRESGSIEEDCDAAILIHRPDYYNPNDFPGQIHIIVAKNRIRGQLKKIQFCKSPNSELFFEQQEIGEVCRKIAQPYKENYDE